METAAGFEGTEILEKDSPRRMRSTQPGTKALPVGARIDPGRPGRRDALLPAIVVWSDVHADGYNLPLVKAS